MIKKQIIIKNKNKPRHGGTSKNKNMDFKLIPTEGKKIISFTIRKIRHLPEKSRIKKIKRKLQKEKLEEEKKMLGNVCIRIINYIDGPGKKTSQDIKEIIDQLQKTVLNLQKERQKILENEYKKLKKKEEKKKNQVKNKSKKKKRR